MVILWLGEEDKMNLADILRLKFPIEFINAIIQVGDRGNGPEIVEWPESYPEPSTENIELWQEEILPLWEKEQFEAINADTLKQLREIDIKSIRALRTNDSARLDELEQQAVILRQQLIKVE